MTRLNPKYTALAVTTATAAAAIWLGTATATAPQPAVILDAEVVRVVDGDTIDVRPVTPIVRIRLLDCWAPERGQPGASEATEHLVQMIHGKKVRVRIESKPKLTQMLTFGRVLGRVWAFDGESDQDVSEAMVAAGHARATREE